MRHLTGPLNQLTAADTVTDAEDYIWATLTDPVPRPDAMAVLRAAYPNAMKLDYAPGGALDHRQRCHPAGRPAAHHEL